MEIITRSHDHKKCFIYQRLLVLMPLDTKTVRKLVKDLDSYRTEKEWADRNIGKVAEKGSKEEVAWLKARQEAAKNELDVIEDSVTKTIVRSFPQRFTAIKAREEGPKKVITKVVPAEEPEIIEVPRSILERISSILETQTTDFHRMARVAEEQLSISQTIRDIAETNKEIHTNISEITYPAAGDTATIPKGTTVLDLWTGDVYLGDGTEAKLTDSLVSLKQSYARSIHVDANRKFSVELDDKAEHTVAADDFYSRRGVECRRISITVGETSNLKFWASTNPDASIDETRNVVVTGVELPLSSRQERWHYWGAYPLPASSYGTISIYNVPMNKRVRLDSINITCPKSSIQTLQLSIAEPGSEFYRDRRYDMQGDFALKDAMMHAGEYLKIRIWNDTNEAQTFYLEMAGLEETIG